jgi:nickel/cobalt transporter (NicO) family protein
MTTLSELLLAPGVFSLGSAAVLGAAHALTPGHGKTAVAAYLAVVRGNAFDAVRLGLIVTMTHTASVFALGLIAHYVSEQVDIRAFYPWMNAVSGLAIAAIGLWLLVQRLRGGVAPAVIHAGEHNHHGAPPMQALGISGGIVPCPEAVALLMIALSRGQSLYGLGLLVSFSIGLAFVLVAIGLAAVAVLPPLKRFEQVMRVLPVMSALVLIVVGIALVLWPQR